MESIEALKQKLEKMNGLLAEAKKQKVSDDKMLASARVKLRELETQMQTHRADAENLKVLMADQKKGLGLRLLAEGDTAFKSALSELKEFEIKQHAAESAIQHLEEERGKILQIIADLRLKNEIPAKLKAMQEEGLAYYQDFKKAFAVCQGEHEKMKGVALRLKKLGGEYNSLNSQLPNRLPRLKFNVVTPFDNPVGVGADFLMLFERFLEQQCRLLKKGNLLL